MRDGDRYNVYVRNSKRLARGNRMSSTFGLAGTGKRFDPAVEDVLEALREPLHRVGRSVHVDRRVGSVRKRANIIDPVDVIRVIVRENNRVDAAHTGGDELKTKLGRRIDEDVRAAVRFDQGADSGTLVPGICRSAHLALTSDLGDAKAGSRPQKGEFQTVSTLSRLVVPGMSNGTPAVTIIRSPFEASSRSTTTDLAQPII